MSEHITHQITLYLDNELQREERRLFEAHVQVCTGCQAALEGERALVEMVRRARPLYRAPDSLRAQVEHMLHHSRSAPRSRRSRALLLTASVSVVLGLALFWAIIRSSPSAFTPPSAFALAAVDAHQRYTHGQLPLEVVSDSPAEISAWFTGKLPFNLKLPNYPEAPGQSKPYEVVGARLLGLAQDYMAYIVYHLHNRPISLLVTSQATAQPSGGEEILWHGLRFHFEAMRSWKVLTWSDNGLTYALVSDFEERGQASCVVCHPNMQHQRVFKGL